ncbi:HupE/UreJ family protein [Pararhizobium haloflavum]|uniref:HupE/UreJ family protein n=1 Tax=Pararhizobium haloflavum TaxID=2037914 RepID=UPI001FE0F5DD|nr:HupE/UreJ family protein [Pararhizobium haloflavum]
MGETAGRMDALSHGRSGGLDTGVVFIMQTVKRAAVAAATTLFATQAFAHHPMGGATPSTFGQGLLSGVGHPIIGLDHLAFIIAVGIAASLTRHRFTMPLFFIAATILGTLVHLMSIGLPLVEFMVSLSVATLGVMLLSGRNWPAGAYAGVFAIAGLFHGHAYGEAVFGAETTPVVAYLLGFGATQYLIAIGAGLVATALLASGRTGENVALRISGGVVAGAGVLLVGEHVLAMVGLA